MAILKFEKGKTAGYRFMQAAPGTTQHKPAVKAGELPPKVDLRPFMSTVENQGQTSSCTANAVAGSYEYLLKRQLPADKQYDVSRLFIYYNARWRNGDQDEDAGSVIQYAMESLEKFGACAETSWPFQKKLVLSKPAEVAYQEAAKFRVKDFQAVPTNLTKWKQTLAEGYPIVFGCTLFDSFDQCNERYGIVPMPDPYDISRSEHSGHAMVCVGYSDPDKVFIVRNSWGSDWGEQGYCYMPYDYLMNKSFGASDNWILRSTKQISEPETTWIPDETPITNDGQGVDFEINPYSIDDYTDLDENLLFISEEIVEYEEASEEYIEFYEYVEEEYETLYFDSDEDEDDEDDENGEEELEDEDEDDEELDDDNNDEEYEDEGEEDSEDYENDEELDDEDYEDDEGEENSEDEELDDEDYEDDEEEEE